MQLYFAVLNMSFSGRALQGSVNLSEILESLTGSQTVQDFMDTPLQEFVSRILGDGDGGTGRSSKTLGDALGQAAAAAKPALTLLDYDNAFTAVQVRRQADAGKVVKELPWPTKSCLPLPFSLCIYLPSVCLYTQLIYISCSA